MESGTPTTHPRSTHIMLATHTVRRPARTRHHCVVLSTRTARTTPHIYSSAAHPSIIRYRALRPQILLVEQTRRYGERWTITGTCNGTWSHPSVLAVNPSQHARTCLYASGGVEYSQALSCALPGREYTLVGMYWE